MSLFPVVNYASQIRGFDSADQAVTTISIPRPAYTWFCMFEIAPDAFSGTFEDGVRTGRVLAATKAIDHPQVHYQIEKLRSYNSVRNVPVRMEYKPMTVTFHDDTTSYVAGLLKAYRAYYTYAGLATASGDFGDGVGENARDGFLPSIGMKMRTGSRNFFKSITVYDLGTAPNSVNIYTFVNPVISDVTHSQLNYEERSGQMEISLTFEYEGYFDQIAVPVNAIPDSVFGQINKMNGVATSANDQFKDEGYFEGVVEDLASNFVSNLPGLIADAFDGGEFDADFFKDALINRTIAGTPLDTVRSLIRNGIRAKELFELGQKQHGFYTAVKTGQDLLAALGIFPHSNSSIPRPNVNRDIGDAFDSALKNLSRKIFG